jgi:ABC-type uncharacterized transport system involved in gliding motility auxiliary subunit
MGQRVLAMVGVLCLLVAAVAVNVMSEKLLAGGGWDLTEDRVHTLSAGSRAIVSDLEAPIRVAFFYSSEQAAGRPVLVEHARRVRELLRSFARASGGMIIIEEVDPMPFSQEEERALAAGIQAVPIEGRNVYFGLAGSNHVDGRQVVRFFDPGIADQLEYDLARVFYTLATPERPRIGLIAGVDIDGGMVGSAVPGLPWALLNEMERYYDVQQIEAGARALPDEIALLVIIQPQGLSEALLYAIDQYVMAGGHAVVAVDPVADVDIPREAREDPRLLASIDNSSDLEPLLGAWGVAYDTDRVVIDKRTAQDARDPNTQEVIPFLPRLSLTPEQMNQDDPITRRLSRLGVQSSGFFEQIEGASTEFVPLVGTSEESMVVRASRVRINPDPRTLLAGYRAEGGSRVIVARVRGEARSAYPAGPPDGAGSRADHRASSVEPIRVVLIADVDMLADTLWIAPRRSREGRIVGADRFADNGELMLGAVNQLVGSDALLSIEPRSNADRPFELVQRMRREAEREFRAEEERLESRIEERTRRIEELTTMAMVDGRAVDAAQQAEVDRLRAEQAESRRRLREVRFELDKDVRELRTTVLLVNIAAVPALVTLIALGLAMFRAARRRSDRARSFGGAA